MDNDIFSLYYLPKTDQFLHCEDPSIAFIYYREFRINLLTGDKEDYSLDSFQDLLKSIPVNYQSEEPIVFHLFFEYGYYCLDMKDKLPFHTPIAYYIKYSEGIVRERSYLIDNTINIDLEITDYPKFEDYNKKFQTVYNNLIDGNCYQVNLTSPFYFKYTESISPKEFIQLVWEQTLSIGAYAHATYIGCLGKMFLSNSPECLFQVKVSERSSVIQTMPIKGTVKVENDSEREQAWEELVNSPKEQAELYMITDLLRNDLAKIANTPAVVKEKKLPLHVPGIVHQYSIIETEVPNSTSLNDIVMALFPGGSITGAPKKRVVGIINSIENYHRGFYCGSTIVCHKSLMASSINIRSAEIDFSKNELKYGSGGGVTLLSQSRSEFEESYLKMKSFLRLLRF